MKWREESWGHSGFTLVEVMIVLAISAAVFVGVAAGVSRTVHVQRYDSAALGIADFLRNTYSEVLNTENSREQNIGSRTFCTLSSAVGGGNDIFTNGTSNAYADYPGRTDCSIYGKIVIFGASDGKIYSFDVVGDAVEYLSKSGQSDDTLSEGADDGVIYYLDVYNRSPLKALKIVNIDYLALGGDSSSCPVTPAASYSSYLPNWDISLNTTEGDPFVGLALIVRSPNNGDVSTYIYEGGEGDRPAIDELISYNLAIESCDGGIEQADYNTLINNNHFWTNSGNDNYLSGFSNNLDELGFCINSDDYYVSSNKKYVSILAGGRNPSAVKVYEDEEARAKCQ